MQAVGDQHQAGEDGGQDEGAARRAARVGDGKPAGQFATARHGQWDFPLKQRPAVERAQATDHNEHRHKAGRTRRPIMADERAEGGAGLRLRRRQCQRDAGTDDQVDQPGRCRADQRRARDGARGVAHLVGRNAGRFKAEQRPERQRGRRGDARAGQALRREGRNLCPAAAHYQQQQDQDDDDRDELDRRGPDLRHAGRPCAGQIDAGHQPQKSDRTERAKARPRQHRQQAAHIRGGGDRDGDIGDDEGNPVGPPDRETGQRAERAGDHLRRAGIRHGDGQPRDDEGQHQRPGDGEYPARHRVPAERCKAGRQQEHARPDHIAHHQRDAGGKAKRAGGGAR